MMKKVLFGMMGAIALSFTACTEDLQVAEVNPTYDAASNSVTANFALNVAGGHATRMTAATVQADGNQTFRGMQDARLLSFAQQDDGKIVIAPTTAEKFFDLGTILNRDELKTDGSKSHRVLELSLPVKTNSLVFYAKAFKDGAAEDQGVINGTVGQGTSGNFAQYISSDLSKIHFDLTGRVSAETKTTFTKTADLIAAICARIMNNGLIKETAGEQPRDLRTSFWFPKSTPQFNTGTGFRDMTAEEIAEADNENVVILPQDVSDFNDIQQVEDEMGNTEYKVTGFKDALGNTYYHIHNCATLWKLFGIEYQNQINGTPVYTMVALEEVLGEVYYKLAKIDENAARAGSGASVARTITDACLILCKVANSEPTSVREQIAKDMAIRILQRCQTYFNGLSNATTWAVTTEPMTWKDADQVAAAYEYYTGENIAEGYNANLNEFPSNLNLPMGAAQLLIANEFDPTKDVEVSYNPDLIKFHLADAGQTQTTSIDKFMFPAELMYFGNSYIRTNVDPISEPDYPEGLANWDKDEWAGNWTKASVPTHVQSTTRSVAMTHDINYGVAMLETTITVPSGVTLYDNRDYFFEGEGNAEVAPKFELTGVLIGGQPGSVDWQFLPMAPVATGDAPTAPAFDNVIYDRVMNGNQAITAAGQSTNPNYTMVFDNYNASLAENAQAAVYVCLELKNNSGADFWGDHNVVRKDGTFYLVGKLDPAATTGVTAPVWPTNTDVFRTTPPYTTDYTTAQINRVFIQDFLTKAHFALGPTSLQNAFVTVPDLRTAELSLGLSVDLKWESGFVFEGVEFIKH